MATLWISVCDECGREARRLIEMDHRLYCSRECYVTACKRLFDERWLTALTTSETIPSKPKVAVSKVA